MKKCTILVGVPGSGKSSYLNEKYWVDGGYVISTDNIIEDIANEYCMTYDDAFKDLIKFAEKVFFDKINTHLKYGDSVIIDRTNLSVKSRSRFFNLLKPHGYTFDAIVFPTPDKKEWDRRLASRIGKTIPKAILETMEKSFQMPTVEEGFTNITIIS